MPYGRVDVPHTRMGALVDGTLYLFFRKAQGCHKTVVLVTFSLFISSFLSVSGSVWFNWESLQGWIDHFGCFSVLKHKHTRVYACAFYWIVFGLVLEKNWPNRNKHTLKHAHGSESTPLLGGPYLC